ncbi:MAG: dockerin type I repeat-containing protein, partial [bacterium]
ISVNWIDVGSCRPGILSVLLAVVLLGFGGQLSATPMQCGHTAQPTCLNSLSLPAGLCVADGWSVDDPTASAPLHFAGVDDHGFGVSHANRFVGVSMFITHVAIQAIRPTAGQTTAILRVRFGDVTSFGDLRPGAVVDTEIVALPTSLSSLDYIVVDLDTTINTMGGTIWLEMYYPTAGGNCQGTREKYTPGQLGESFVVTHESSAAAETWVDYENVSPDTSGSYNDRACVLRPLQLTDCARTCYVTVGGLDFQTSEDGDSISLGCFITEPPVDTVIVDISSTDSTEGIPRASQFIFTPTNWSITQNFWVVGQDDPITDGDIFYHIQAVATSNDSCYDGEFNQYGCSNIDNDIAFIGTMPVGNANNPADITGHGSVGYDYEIGTYEVTNEQYAEYLNATAVCDFQQAWDPFMFTDPMGGIERVGDCPNSSYVVKANMGNKPVNFLTLQDCMRFVNWLHNGKPTGGQDPTTTENGVYDLSLGLFSIIPRQSGATWAVGTIDELYKAAFYDPVDPGADANGTLDYWLFPTSSDAGAVQATANSVGDISNPGPDVVNFGDAAIWNGVIGNVTTVGSAGPLAASPSGSYDQCGNVAEWTEDQYTGGGFTFSHVVGSNCHSGLLPAAPEFDKDSLTTPSQSAYVGFRVVKLNPTGSGVCGDANTDSITNITDAVYLIQYIFNSGPAPVPLLAGDANCDGIVNITDAVYLIQFIFGGGPDPCDPDDNGVPDC